MTVTRSRETTITTLILNLGFWSVLLSPLAGRHLADRLSGFVVRVRDSRGTPAEPRAFTPLGRCFAKIHVYLHPLARATHIEHYV